MRTFVFAVCVSLSIGGLVWGQTQITIASPRATDLRAKAGDVSGPRPAAAPADGTTVPFSIAGPTLGFVFDRDASAVRRVPGVPGSAFLGEELELGLPLKNAYAAPQQDYVVGISSDTQSVLLISLVHGAVNSATTLDTVPSAPDRVVFSPSGDSIALYYQNSRTVLSVTGVPGAPRMVSSWSLPEYLGNLSSLAIKDGGGVALAGVATDSVGGLMLLSNDGSTSLLLPMGHPTAAEFLWGRGDAVVADAGQGQVYLLSNVAGAVSTRVLTRLEDGLANPDLVAVDRFAQTAVVGQRGGSGGLRVNLADGSVQPFDCGCAMSVMEPLNGNASYRLTDVQAGQFFALDNSGANAVVQTILQTAPAPLCTSAEWLTSRAGLCRTPSRSPARPRE